MSEPTRHVVFRLADGRYAIEAEAVVEMQALGELEPHPHGSALIRGVSSLRGRRVPVVDLRGRLGLTSARGQVEELSAAIEEQRRAHADRVSAALACLDRGEAPPPSTGCRLAQVLAEACKRSTELGALTARLTGPHEALHRDLEEARARAQRGDLEGALARARAAEASAVGALLERAAAYLATSIREIVLYVEVGGTWRGLVVDAVESVVDLASRRDPDVAGDAPFVRGIATDSPDAAGVFVLDLEALLSGRPRAAHGEDACSIAS